MEASQASEAGSIPVARSSPARPRAGRFCYAHFAPTVDRMRRDNRRNTLPARVGARGSGTKLAPHEPHGATSGTKLTPREPHGATSGTKLSPRELGPAVPVQNSPCTPKISQFGAFCSCWESFIPFLLPTSRAWRILSRYHQQQDRHATTPGTKLAQQAQKRRIWGVLSAQGELFRTRHDNYAKSNRSRPLRRTHIVHVKPPAPMLSFGSKLLKPTTPLRASPS